jgi:hypothetical protein
MRAAIGGVVVAVISLLPSGADAQRRATCAEIAERPRQFITPEALAYCHLESAPHGHPPIKLHSSSNASPAIPPASSVTSAPSPGPSADPAPAPIATDPPPTAAQNDLQYDQNTMLQDKIMESIDLGSRECLLGSEKRQLVYGERNSETIVTIAVGECIYIPQLYGLKGPKIVTWLFETAREEMLSIPGLRKQP